jgi:protein translocase, SecG subunit
MDIFISILIIISSVLLVLVVLVQNSKGGGLASGFSSSNQVLGVRKTTDFLEKATWTLAGIVVILCVLITFTLPEKGQVAGSDVLPNVSAPMTPAAAPSMPNFESLPQGEAEGTETPLAETPAE